MSKPLIVSIPHRLGKDEALRRIKTGLGDVRAKFGQFLRIEDEVWTDNRLQFRISALAQSISGTIDVLDDYVRLEVLLPEFLAKIAAVIQPLIHKEATLLLEKK
jgi:Putative polyhydroxyalkanoic acid system protein (PHA_gran_rgn)